MILQLRRALLTIPFILPLGCGEEEPERQRQLSERAKKEITVVAISDFHGALATQSTQTADGKVVEWGGAALVSSYVQRIRERTEGPVLLIDGGDVFQGTLVSNTREGAPVVQFYNYLGVHAAAVGNHEFDYGPVGKNTIPKEKGDDPRGAIKLRAKEAKFPFLAANILNEEGEAPSWMKKSVLLTFGDTRVGIVGATSEDTPYTTVKRNLKGLTVTKIPKRVIRQARELRIKGADFIILTMHGGSRCDDNSAASQYDLSTCDLDEELFQVVDDLPEGLFDFVIGGHTHRGVAKVFKGAALLQAFAKGTTLMWAKKTKGEKADIQEPVMVCGHTVPDSRYGRSCLRKTIQSHAGSIARANFLGAPIEKDQKVVRLLAEDFERVRKIKEAPLGIAALGEFVRAYRDESSLGNLITDLMRVYPLPKIEGFELANNLPKNPKILAMTNNGGIRDNIKVGPLNYGHIFDVLPFDNRLALLTIDGAMLEKIILSNELKLSWSGVEFEVDQCKLKSAKVLGDPLDQKERYWVVTNDYLAMGGSGFDELGLKPENVRILDELPMLRDAAVHILKGQGKDIDPKDFYNSEDRRQKTISKCKK